VVVDGEPVNVIELGPLEKPVDPEGSQPLLFVHGLSGSWQNWLEQLPVFAAEHRVVAIDLPGFGHSPMPSWPISISAYARMLNRLLDVLRIDAAAVVGNSMGGFVSAELAIAFPQRVERLVLVSPSGLSSYRPDATRALGALQRLERILAAETAWVASKSDTVARRPRLREATLRLVARHPDRLGAALAAEQLRGAGKPGFMPALAAHLEYDFRDRLQEIACPTLIVWGKDDRVVTVRDASVFTELIPNSRAVLYEDTGHVAMLERPDAFNALLEAFLSE
jgi:pimeloyl-ACP methyl ester carboxylesterase